MGDIPWGAEPVTLQRQPQTGREGGLKGGSCEGHGYRTSVRRQKRKTFNSEIFISEIKNKGE